MNILTFPPKQFSLEAVRQGAVQVLPSAKRKKLDLVVKSRSRHEILEERCTVLRAAHFCFSTFLCPLMARFRCPPKNEAVLFCAFVFLKTNFSRNSANESEINQNKSSRGAGWHRKHMVSFL